MNAGHETVRDRRGHGTRPPRRLVSTEPFLANKALRGAIDVATWVVAGFLAFMLEREGTIPPEDRATVWLAMAGLLVLKLGVTLAFRLHRQSWVRTTLRDARRVALAMMSATAVAAAAALVARPLVVVPLAVPLLDGMISLLLMLGTRSTARSLDDRWRRQRASDAKPRNVLMIGAGDGGEALAREMRRHPEMGKRPVGFLDDDPAKRRRRVASVPVLGGLDLLEHALEHFRIDEVLITIPSAHGVTIRHIVERVRAVSPRMPCRTMPALVELLSGEVTVTRIRDVGIEDLLRRPPVKLDTDSILGYLQGKRVMITGAGGSIGSELVRQMCRFAPAEMVLVGHGENSIYQLERELERDWPKAPYHSVIAAVQNLQRLDVVFGRHRPDVVFHTAAHKHVPLMEANPEEAVFNNVVGSRNVVRLALKHGVTHFVNVSTDKAVNAGSVMGASKRVVELIVENAAREAADGQTFVSVRFGNVLGSRGSAVTLFKEQILAGGPVTVTHPEMRRYFMTIPEAAQLVLQATALGRNGEIYILDMGEPVRVVELARDLIRLSGLEPGVDIPIVFTGIRPGEKLFEELMSEEEKRNRTRHEHIVVARSASMAADRLEALVQRLVEAAMNSDGEAIRRAFAVGVGRLDAGTNAQGERAAEGDEARSRLN
jgi:FlaA1/EpsC-like NDP-sugar epimerase